MGGSGAGTAKTQLNQQNDLQNQAFKSQMDTLDSLKGSLSGYLSGDKGFTGQQQSYMTTQALNQNTQKYNQAGNQVRQALAARGMSGSQTPGGGATAGTLAGLYGAKASDASNAVNTLNLQNAQQGLNNQFNAASVLSGNAQTMGQNVGTFGSGANNALGQYVTAERSSGLNQFLGGLGQGLGGGLSAMATGGLGTALSGIGAASSIGSFGSLNGWGAASQLPGSFSGGAPSFGGGLNPIGGSTNLAGLSF